MIDKELILKSIRDLANECRSHSECKDCIFFDKLDDGDMCMLKNTQEIPSEWYIG